MLKNTQPKFEIERITSKFHNFCQNCYEMNKKLNITYLHVCIELPFSFQQ